MFKHENLKGRVAVITGGGGVLCSGFAKDLASQGMKTAILDLNKDAAQAVADEITAAGGTAIAVACNVLDADSLADARKEINEKLGTCDLLLNGAGGNNPKGTTSKDKLELSDIAQKAEGIKTFFDLDPAGVGFVFNLNFLGTLLPTQVFARAMAEKGCGSIINISGKGGSFKLYSVYGCSFFRRRHKSKRNSSGLFLNKPEQNASLQSRRLTFRTLGENYFTYPS